MKSLVRISVVCGSVLAPWTPASAASNAAEYLMAEQVKTVCPQGGAWKPDGVTERDVTGDGAADLILDLSGLVCQGASNGLNDECGAAHCPVLFYVRKGSLLKLNVEITSIGADVGSGDRPRIGLVDFQYRKHSVRWNGSTFK